MKYAIDKSFERDAKKAPQNILKQLPGLLATIKSVENLQKISDLKKLRGYRNVFRIRIDDYRLGCYLENQTLVLSRLLPRKDIYKRFP